MKRLTLLLIMCYSCFSGKAQTFDSYYSWTNYTQYLRDSTPDSILYLEPKRVLFPEEIYFRTGKGRVVQSRMETIGQYNFLDFSPIWDDDFEGGTGKQWVKIDADSFPPIVYLDSLSFCYKYKQNRVGVVDTLEVDVLFGDQNAELRSKEGHAIYTGATFTPYRSLESVLLDSSRQTDDFYSSAISSYECISLPCREAIHDGKNFGLILHLRLKPGYTYSESDTANFDSLYNGAKNINPFIPLIFYAKAQNLKEDAYTYGVSQNDPKFHFYNTYPKPAWSDGPDSFPVMHLHAGFGCVRVVVSAESYLGDQSSLQLRTYENHIVLFNKLYKPQTLTLFSSTGAFVQSFTLPPRGSFLLAKNQEAPRINYLQSDKGWVRKIIR